MVFRDANGEECAEITGSNVLLRHTVSESMYRKKMITLMVAVVGVVASVIVYQQYSLPQRGERAFQRLGCPGCHFTGAGPNLTHAVRRYDAKLLEQFIANPPAVYRQRGMKPLNEGHMLMPDMHASSSDAQAIVAYLSELDEQ